MEKLNYAFKLIELSESMEDSIKNIKNVICQQEEMTDIIEKTTTKNDFKPYIKESREQLANLNKQVEVLDTRKQKLQDCIELMKADEKVATAVSLLMEAVNMLGKTE